MGFLNLNKCDYSSGISGSHDTSTIFTKYLLQLLYDCNIITAIEIGDNGKPYFHFSYREKSSANINPKVCKGENISYRFHYGLYKKTKKGRY